MKAANNYLKNVMKSVAYAAADVTGQYTPNIKEFTSTNKEFTTATYAALKNPSQYIRRSVTAIQESKVYKALDYGARNLVEDLRTGNFYNKAREDQDLLGFSGLDVDSWDDLSEFGIDDDWESNLNSKKSNVKDEVTTGDIKITESIEGSNAALASATVNAVIKSSENQIKAGRADTGMLYMQNERLFAGLHSDMTVLGNTMQQMYNLQSASLQNIDKNLSEFFTQESKLNTERNAILKEILEIQRRAYTPLEQKQKDANSRKSSRITWADINTNGIPDLGAYFEAVKNNISKQLGSIMPAGFGEDSNMLAAVMVSPLSGVMKYVVDGVIPATVKAAANQLDGTISGVFGNIIAELGNARSSSDKGLLSNIAKFFGVSTSVNRNIDTSRYEKGPVPFDGITRKAIVDIIPTHLRRIEAAITGREEEMFDYKTGKWVNAYSIKSQFENIKKNAMAQGTSNIRRYMDSGLKAVREGINEESELNSWDKAVEEFYAFYYSNNGRFNSKASADKNGIDRSNYPNLYKHFSKIKTIYRDFDKQEYKDDKGNKKYRNVRNSIRARGTVDVLDAKVNEENQYRNIETDFANIFQMYFSSPKIDAHGKHDSETKTFKAYNVLNTTDSKGNTIFNYLYNITEDLMYIRYNGIPGGRGSGNGGSNNGGNPPSGGKTLEEIRKSLDRSGSESKYNARQQKRENIRKSALEKINSGKAVDLRDFEINEQDYLLNLSHLASEGNIEDFKDEIAGYNSNFIASYIDKHFLKTNIKSKKDIEEAIKKAEKENKTTDEVSDKEETFFKKLLNKIGGEGILGGIASASTEAFTNLLYTADRAIYEMMYKQEILDDEDNTKKYNGFLEAMTGKLSDKFKDIGEQFKKDVIEPFKKAFNIEDDFGERFKTSIEKFGTNLWTSFKDANASVYGPAFHDVQSALGFSDDPTKKEKKNREARLSIKDEIKNAKNAKNLYDNNFIELLRKYGLNYAEYNSVEEARKDLMQKLSGNLYNYTNDLQETNLDFDDINTLMDYIKSDKNIMQKVIRKNNINIENVEEDKLEDYITKTFIERLYKTTSKERFRITNSKNAHAASMYLDSIGKSGDLDQKKQQLKELGREKGLDINVDKYNTIEEVDDSILRFLNKYFHHAAGTPSGRPYTGLTTLTKGEGLINGSGFGVVPKTGVYNVTTPTHIINTEDMHSITGGPKVSVQQALGKEKLAAKSAGFNIAHHDEGTIKITNGKLDTEQVLEEAKQYIPEAAGGGLIGAILSMVLGLAGGPLVGAAIGAGGSIISNSNSLKNALFGKMGEDGKRDGTGIVSKKIVDTFTRSFPDMKKYGLAGILPGLITPLGPIGGLLVGGAFGYLKNSEGFTNKYFGEEGVLTLKSKEKKIIEDMLPKGLKGAGIGLLSSLFLPTPFGILGNAAIGAAIGMTSTTEDFKSLILGTEINGERVGGLAGIIKQIFEPLSDAVSEASSKLLDSFEKNIIKPLANTTTSLIHALPTFFGTLPRLIGEGIDKLLGGRIHRTINSISQGVGGFVGRTAGKFVKGAGNIGSKLLGGPGWLLNQMGDGLRAYNIKHGDTENMTIKQAVNWMKDSKYGSNLDPIMAKAAKIGTNEKGAISLEDAKFFRNAMYALNTSESKAKKEFNKNNRVFNAALNDFRTDSGKAIDTKYIKDIIDLAEDGKFGAISKVLMKAGLSKDEFNRLYEEKGLKDILANLQTSKEAYTKFKDKDALKNNEKLKSLQEILGIKDLTNPKERAKLDKFFSQRITELEAHPDDIYNQREDENNENIKTLVSGVDDIVKLLAGIASDDSDFKKDVINDVKSRVEFGQNAANKSYDKNVKNKAESLSNEDKENLYKEEFSVAKDLMTTKKGAKFVNKYGTRVANNIASKDVEKVKKALSNKSLTRAFTKGIQKYLSDDAIKAIDNLQPNEVKLVRDALNNKYIYKAITMGHYQLTDVTISIITNSSNLDELKRRCMILNQIFIKTKKDSSIYTQFNSLDEILDKKDFDNLISEYGIDYTSSLSGSIFNLDNYKRDAKYSVHSIINNAGKFGKWVGNRGYDLVSALTKQHHPGYRSDKWYEDNHSNGDADQNGIGTFLLGAGKKLLGAGKNIAGKVKSLFTKKSEDEQAADHNAGFLSGLLNAGSGLVKKVGGSFFGGSSTDEIDDPNDGREPMHVGDGNIIQVSRKSDGSVEPDTSDSHTRSVLNLLAVKEKMTQKFQEAQIKASELIKNTFDTSHIKESKGGKLGWFSLLLGGGLLLKSGLLGKIFNGIIKPAWTDHIKPWITDTAVPWIKDKWDNNIKPWITDTAIPALGKVMGDVAYYILKNLPDLIKAAIKGTSFFLDAFTGNENNVGASTQINGSTLVENIGENKDTGMRDENGNILTTTDIQNGNYNEIYNHQGVQGTVDENGNVTFEDESSPGSSYLSAIFEGGSRNFLWSAITGKPNVLIKAGNKISNKLLKKRGILSKILGGTGKSIFGPMDYFGELGAKAGGYTTKEAAEKAAKKTAKEAVEEVAEQAIEAGAKKTAGNTTLISKLLKRGKEILDILFSDKKVVKKISELGSSIGITDIQTWLKKFRGQLDDLIATFFKKNSDKVTTEVVEKVASKWLLAILFVVIDFLEGCDKAESILMVEETTIAEEVVAGLINVLGGLLIFPAVFPDMMTWFVTKLYDFFGKDLSDRQAEAFKKYEEYVQENGSTLTEKERLEVTKSVSGFAEYVGLEQTKKKWGINNDGIAAVVNILDSTPVLGDNLALQNYIANRDEIGKLISGEKSIKEAWNDSVNGIKNYPKNKINEYKTIFDSFFDLVTRDESVETPNGSSGSSHGGFGKNRYSKQIDPSISGMRFNNSRDSEYQTIGNSGCGPAAAVNVLESMYGRGSDLVSAAKYALKGGYKEVNGGTTPEFFTDYFSSNGLNSNISYNRSEIQRNISNGLPTVIMGKDPNGVSSRTPFGSTPHYVTVTGTDGRGNAIVQDPESRYDDQLYPINDLINNTQLGVSAFGKNYKIKWGKGTDDEAVWKFLKGMGMTDAGAAGMMGNLYAESNLYSNILQGTTPGSNKTIEYTRKVDSGEISEREFVNRAKGYGLAQWTSSNRKQGLYNLAKERNTSIADLTTQLLWLRYELENGYKNVLDVLKTSNNLSETSDIVLTKFERPKNQGDFVKFKRRNNGKNYLNKYSGVAGTSITDSNYNYTDESYSSTNDGTDNTTTESGNYLENLFGNFIDNISSWIDGISLTNSSNTSNSNYTRTNTQSRPNNIKLSGVDANNMVNIARNEVGTKEIDINNVKYNDWYYGANVSGKKYPWCAAFTSWVANQAGVPTSVMPKTASTKTSYDKIKQYGGKVVSGSESMPGDIIFFTKNGTRDGIYHTGIVTGNSGSKISTIEGNSSDMVREKSYNVGDKKILVTRPKYTNTGELTHYNNSTNVSSGDLDYSNTRGSNGYKPLSRYGQFKNSIYGTGSTPKTVMHKSKEGYVNAEVHPSDVVDNKTNVATFGMGTNNIDYTKLINSIIAILMSIADNTDKLNLIFDILNNKLNLNITASDVSNATTNKQSLKSKLSNALNGINISKFNNDNVNNNSINSIISAMNAIASE